jgi:tripartite-type tricarboxylate transporter receptor subunit TctC
MRKWRRLVCALGLMALLPAARAQAPDWPVRPLRIIVGPGQDILARVFGEKLTELLGQQVVVDQRPGGGGLVAVETTVRAAPDGYTLLNSTGSIVIGVGLFTKSPYDLTRDLTPAGLIVTVANILMVHPAVPARSVAELIQFSRANPGKLNFASGGTGTAAHLTGELLKDIAKINMIHVPYKSVAQATTDVMGGHAQLIFLTTPAAVPLVASGRLRALAVSSATRTSALPDLPTMMEAGVTGFEYSSWNGIHLPPQTPRAVVARVHAALEKVGMRADLRERVMSMGMEPAISSPAALGELVKSDLAKWRGVMQAAGIRPE